MTLPMPFRSPSVWGFLHVVCGSHSLGLCHSARCSSGGSSSKSWFGWIALWSAASWHAASFLLGHLSSLRRDEDPEGVRVRRRLCVPLASLNQPAPAQGNSPPPCLESKHSPGPRAPPELTLKSEADDLSQNGIRDTFAGQTRWNI